MTKSLVGDCSKDKWQLVPFDRICSMELRTLRVDRDETVWEQHCRARTSYLPPGLVGRGIQEKYQSPLGRTAAEAVSSGDSWVSVRAK